MIGVAPEPVASNQAKKRPAKTTPKVSLPLDASILSIVANLEGLDLNGLRRQWRTHLGGEPPAQFQRWLLTQSSSSDHSLQLRALCRRHRLSVRKEALVSLADRAANARDPTVPSVSTDPGLVLVRGPDRPDLLDEREGWIMSVKLTDAQLVMMSAAAQRKDRCLSGPATIRGAALSKVTAKLTKLGLVREIEAKFGAAIWRRDDAGRGYALKLTAAGLKAIAVDERSPDAIDPERRRSRRRRMAPVRTKAATQRGWAPREMAASWRR